MYASSVVGRLTPLLVRTSERLRQELERFLSAAQLRNLVAFTGGSYTEFCRGIARVSLVLWILPSRPAITVREAK